MLDGYVKLWRVSLEKPIFQNAQLWQFATWCLMKATHKKRKQMVGMQVVDLNPGQFVMGRNAAAEKLGTTPQRIRTCISKLKTLEFLTTKTTNKFTIITIINWEAYQSDDDKCNQQNNHQLTSKQPATNHKQECEEDNSNLTVTCEDSGESPPKKDRCPHQKIKSLCDTILPEWRKHRVWDGANADQLRARWNAKYESLGGKKSNTIEFWEGAFKHCRSSPFLMGQVPPSPGHVQFQGSLAWFVKKSNFEKFMEGFYHR